MEFSNILQLAINWLVTNWGKVLSGLIPAAIFVWINLRTKSPHLLYRWLMYLALGKGDDGNDAVSDFLRRRDLLMKFRFSTGLNRVPTFDSAERLIQWCHKHQIDTDLIYRAGHYFDVNKPGFKKKPPNSFKSIAAITISSLMFAVSMVLMAVGYTNPAYLKVVKTGNKYLVNESQAQVLNSLFEHPGEILSLKDCDKVENANLKIDIYDRESICQLMTTDEGKKYIRHSKNLQAWFSFAISAIFAFFGSLFCLEWNKIESARRLYDETN